MSLHARLAWLIAATVTLALLAQGLFGYLEFQRSALHDVNTDLNAYLATLAHDRAEGESPRTIQSESGIRARLVRDGRTVQEYGGAFPATLDPDGDTHWIVRRVGVPDLGRGAVLEASLPLHAYNQGLNAYLRTVFLSVTVMSVLGAAVALLLSRSALRPLAHVLELAEQVTESGDLTVRVPEPRGSGEVARLGHTFNAMLSRLSAFRDRETEFTRHASHELRTPLTAMRAQLDANKHGWVTDAEVLQTADEQVERLSRLTSALLLLSRENRTDVAHFDLAGRVRTMTEQHGTDFQGPASLMFLGNETLITQALENLLRNAHRHAPGAQVRVVLVQIDHTVQLSVADDGPGVSSEELAHLGEAFYRAAGVTVSGSGLGLAVVQRVAEVHGGQVGFGLVEPHGLSVTMMLPQRHSLRLSSQDAQGLRLARAGHQPRDQEGGA